MSYSFNIKKVNGELVVENGGHAAQHLPEGAAFTVQGHIPSADSSQYGSIGVTLTVPFPGADYGQLLAAASGGCNAAPPPAAVTLSETVSAASGAAAAGQVYTQPEG